MISPARHGGRKRSINIREVLNAICYLLWTGCQWKALPKDLPPKSTAHYYFMLWDWDGTLEHIHHALYVAVREQAAREASPTVAIIDSQSSKAAQKEALRLDPQRPWMGLIKRSYASNFRIQRAPCLNLEGSVRSHCTAWPGAQT